MWCAGAAGTVWPAAAIARHAGARFVVITDVNGYRLELARKMGVTLAVNITRESLSEVMQRLGMKEGFDVGMEMSETQRFPGMIDVMSHGGKIALLGLQPMARGGLERGHLQRAHHQGIYGREMYETWYKMTSMLQSGLTSCPLSPIGFPTRSLRKGSRSCVPATAAMVLHELGG
jgi:threonine 3-dehydrogenase